MTQTHKTTDPSLRRDPITGALLNTNNSALAEHKLRRAHLRKINTLEKQSEETSQRLTRIEDDMSELKSLLIQAIKNR